MGGFLVSGRQQVGELQIRVGCEFRYDVKWPVPAVVQVRPREDGAHRVLHETSVLTPQLPLHEYRDLYGNICQRLTMPAGEFVLRYDAQVAVPDSYDEQVPQAAQVPPEALPDDALLYTLPSRYCLSDVLSDVAWQLFGGATPGWGRVQAICDWVHANVRFQYGTSTPLTTAVDVYEKRVGVCRDFTHLGVTFCRALNIPARYVFGYLPDIGVPPTDAPMDFCAWFEAYLGDRWWPFDPRNNTPRIGRTVIGRGRDALDVAMVTTYGTPRLVDMIVWAAPDEQVDRMEVEAGR
jgi:transglutaminase-like putative cysteine protease